MNKLVNGLLVELTQEEEAEIAAAEEEEAARRLAELPQKRITECTEAIQDMLDNHAISYGYDSVHTAVTYAEEPGVLKFQNEGKAFRAWRSLCWAAGYAIVAEHTAAGTLPEVSDVLDAMPDFIEP